MAIDPTNVVNPIITWVGTFSSVVPTSIHPPLIRPLEPTLMTTVSDKSGSEFECVFVFWFVFGLFSWLGCFLVRGRSSDPQSVRLWETGRIRLWTSLPWERRPARAEGWVINRLWFTTIRGLKLSTSTPLDHEPRNNGNQGLQPTHQWELWRRMMGWRPGDLHLWSNDLLRCFLKRWNFTLPHPRSLCPSSWLPWLIICLFVYEAKVWKTYEPILSLRPYPSSYWHRWGKFQPLAVHEPQKKKKNSWTVFLFI